MRAKTVLGICITVGLAAGLFRCAADEPTVAGATLLPHRLWVDRMPDDERDMVRKFVVVQSIDHGRYGVAELGSVWRHRTEVFKWKLDGDRLRMALPQDRRHLEVKVRAWNCKGEAPRPFELCLELRRGNKVKRMYSRRDWVLRPRPSGDDLLEDGPLANFELPVLVEARDVGTDSMTETASGLDQLWSQ